MDINVLIPQFCYCCAEGSNEISDIAFEKFISCNNPRFIDFTRARNILVNHFVTMLNPQFFFDTINLIFEEIRLEYKPKESKMIINSLKRIMSLVATGMTLNQIRLNNISNCVINDCDEWFDFVDSFKDIALRIDAIVYTRYSKKKHFAFCPIEFEENDFFAHAEVMMSQIPDYWVNSVNLD